MNTPYAKYTETFDEFIKNNPSFLNDTLTMSTQDRSSKLISALISKYRFYEIGGETEDMFKYFIEDTFNEHKDYFEELINAYDKEYDYATSNKQVVSREDEYENNKSGTTDNKHIEIDLPNKVVTESYEGYPNALNKDSQSKDDNSSGSTSSVITTTFDNEFIDLKNKYIRQLRNVYKEFAERFKDCFIIIY